MMMNLSHRVFQVSRRWNPTLNIRNLKTISSPAVTSAIPGVDGIQKITRTDGQQMYYEIKDNPKIVGALCVGCVDILFATINVGLRGFNPVNTPGISRQQGSEVPAGPNLYKLLPHVFESIALSTINKEKYNFRMLCYIGHDQIHFQNNDISELAILSRVLHQPDLDVEQLGFFMKYFDLYVSRETKLFEDEFIAKLPRIFLTEPPVVNDRVTMDEDKKSYLIVVKSFDDARKLVIQTRFKVDDDVRPYTLQVLAYMMSLEGPGSLSNYLYRKLWATGCKAEYDCGGDLSFFMTIHLTNEGLVNFSKVIRAVHAYWESLAPTTNHELFKKVYNLFDTLSFPENHMADIKYFLEKFEDTAALQLQSTIKQFQERQHIHWLYTDLDEETFQRECSTGNVNVQSQLEPVCKTKYWKSECDKNAIKDDSVDEYGFEWNPRFTGPCFDREDFDALTRHTPRHWLNYTKPKKFLFFECKRNKPEEIIYQEMMKNIFMFRLKPIFENHAAPQDYAMKPVYYMSKRASGLLLYNNFDLAAPAKCVRLAINDEDPAEFGIMKDYSLKKMKETVVKSDLLVTSLLKTLAYNIECSQSATDLVKVPPVTDRITLMGSMTAEEYTNFSKPKEETQRTHFTDFSGSELVTSNQTVEITAINPHEYNSYVAIGIMKKSLTEEEKEEIVMENGRISLMLPYFKCSQQPFGVLYELGAPKYYCEDKRNLLTEVNERVLAYFRDTNHIVVKVNGHDRPKATTNLGTTFRDEWPRWLAENQNELLKTMANFEQRPVRQSGGKKRKLRDDDF